MSLYLLLFSSETILHHIASDTTLTVSNSPYIVNSYVTFHSTAHIIIENGVEIIFIHDYFISVFGSLTCGCNTQILNNKTKGLSNTNTYVHIHGNESAPMSIGIFINQQSRIINPPKIEFCNTLFENIQNGIVTTSKQYAPYTIHNCEFKSVNNAIKHSTNVINFVYNSYFHEMSSIHSGGGVIYDHCLFRLFGKFSSNMEQAYNIAIRNSEIYGNENQICININSIAGDPYYGIYNNIINGCKDGIEIWNVVTIRNNTINNCSRYGIYIKNIDISWIYDVDVMYNIFDGNGQYDIYMDNVNSVNVEYNYINTIYGQNCDMLTIYMNEFIGRGHNHMITVQNGTAINVSGNRFINNEYKLGLLGVLYVYNNSKYINISSNIFMGNTMKYLIKMEDIMKCAVHSNDIINNTIYQYMIDSNCNEVSLQYNRIQDNIQEYVHEFIRIQTPNRVFITDNSFMDNRNNVVDIPSNLLYLYQPQELDISYNIFDTNDVDHILYINYSEYTHTISSIEYNDFIQKHNPIHNYIHIYTGIMNTQTEEQLLYINLNNFYDAMNVNNFIATNNTNISAKSNYYDGLKSYIQISAKLNDVCDHNTIGFINITRISEYPIHINHIMNMSLIYHCSWDILNCTTISNYFCDSDTYSPTIPPTILPTPKPPTLIFAASTANPTSFPSSFPSNTPSNLPTEYPTVGPSPYLDLDRFSDKQSYGAEDTVVILSVSIVSVIIILLCYCFWKKRKRGEKNDYMHPIELIKSEQEVGVKIGNEPHPQKLNGNDEEDMLKLAMNKPLPAAVSLFAEIDGDIQSDDMYDNEMYDQKVDNETKTNVENGELEGNVKEWFNTEIQLNEYNEIYYGKFIENGFDNMKSINLLTKQHLEAIGINKLGHQLVLLKAVNSL